MAFGYEPACLRAACTVDDKDSRMIRTVERFIILFVILLFVLLIICMFVYFVDN